MTIKALFHVKINKARNPNSYQYLEIDESRIMIKGMSTIILLKKRIFKS